MSTLRMYTIYDHPSDYPDSYVVRAFTITRDGPVPGLTVEVCDTLERARQIAGFGGRYCLPREPDDDPVILESWL